MSNDTLKTRFRNVMHFKPCKHIPNFEFGYWAETLPNWHEQGLPREVDNEGKAYEYFGIESSCGAGPNSNLIPAFEEKFVGMTGTHKLLRDAEGALLEIPMDGHSTIPRHLEYGLKGRSNWDDYLNRLDPNTPDRIAGDLDELPSRIAASDKPWGIWIGSLIGTPRNWIGFENLALMVYDDPGLVDEIAETMCRLIISGITPYLEKCSFDYAGGWEDICFNSGPIMSPAMFEKFLGERYKRIADLLRAHGVDVIYTDCDGNITGLVPIWLKTGYNCMFPIEVNGGSDPVALREKYGKKILLLGGFNKMALLKGPKAIEKELLRLAPTVAEGGFIPHVDHRVPANVTLDNYKSYLKLKRDIFNAGGPGPQYKI